MSGNNIRFITMAMPNFTNIFWIKRTFTCTENQQKETALRETREETPVENKAEKKFELDVKNSKLDIQKEDDSLGNRSVFAFSDVSYKASRYAQDATEDALTETPDARMASSPDAPKHAKGQEISKGNCGVLKYSKKNNECFTNFCPKGLKWVKLRSKD